jgi:signal peptidase I
MNLIFFAAWVAAGAVLILPLGMLLRLARRLTGRGRARPPGAVPTGTAPALEAAGTSPDAGSLEAEEPGLTAASAGEKAVPQPGRRRTQRLASALSFLLYVAFIAGAVYYVPQILSWVLDTPYPMASVSSQSMWPALNKGDLIFLQGVDKADDLQIGDIIAFQHEKGITVHRVLEIDGDVITTQGDANPVADQPIQFDQVVGRVITIGGRVAKVPYVGSIAGLFAPFATQAGQSPEQEAPSAEGSAGASAPAEFGASTLEQTPSPQPVNPSPGTTEMVSVDSAGNQANGFSTWPAISADGRFVAFASDASNLVPGDSNGQGDIFVHDRQTGATERVSVDSAGGQADGSSSEPVISGDGRFVVFVCDASNLVPGDSNGQGDVFVHDRQTGATERVSVDSAGNQGDGGSGKPAISADGRFVAFESDASNLVPGDSNGQSDVFVHDRQTGATERVSVDSAGSQGDGGSGKPAISADGRFVAFESDAANLVLDDANSRSDVFVRDRQTGATERVSVDGHGTQSDGSSTRPAISADGRFVAFESMATNLVSHDFNRQHDIFVHDRQTGATERVSVSSDGRQVSSPSNVPAISADGRFVAFASGARNLAPGDDNRFYFADVFVHDCQTGATERVSANSAGNQGNDYSGLPAISGDGRFVAFWSLAADLAPVDHYGQHVFVRDRGTPDGGQQ